ncbi:hypothetical protein ACF068_12425 [Streptomyces sp. NPDC016309]|uniref:hypothetical protein n=1 Tax=Streptomyces sp. NPDC016309 TaxID=3364965 RepID=UPI003700ED8C
MTESYASNPTDDLWQAKAANALKRAVITTSGVPDGRRPLAVEMLTILMNAGLPISDLHADSDGGLVYVEGSPYAAPGHDYLARPLLGRRPRGGAVPAVH